MGAIALMQMLCVARGLQRISLFVVAPTTMVRALMAAGPTDKPSSATENCMQTSPIASVMPPATAKPTRGPLRCPSWSVKFCRPCSGPPTCAAHKKAG